MERKKRKTTKDIAAPEVVNSEYRIPSAPVSWHLVVVEGDRPPFNFFQISISMV